MLERLGHDSSLAPDATEGPTDGDSVRRTISLTSCFTLSATPTSGILRISHATHKAG
jgi:hypothetical protein